MYTIAPGRFKVEVMVQEASNGFFNLDSMFAVKI